MLDGIQIANKVLDEGWCAFDAETLADYDAIFSQNEEPIFLNIWKTGLNVPHTGFLVMHHFLERVGVDRTFVSTAMTPAGEHLFQRLVDDGVLAREKGTGSLGYPHRFRVISDPMENLRAFASNKAPCRHSPRQSTLATFLGPTGE